MTGQISVAPEIEFTSSEKGVANDRRADEPSPRDQTIE